MGSDRVAPRVSWDELQAMMPAVIKETLPLVPWRIDRLWELKLPVRKVAVADLAWLLELPLWQSDGVRFQVTPAQVRGDPQRHPDHFARVMACDLRYPIHLVEHNGRPVVLDGFHRLLKAAVEGRGEIDAMVLSQQDLELICASS